MKISEVINTFKNDFYISEGRISNQARLPEWFGGGTIKLSYEIDDVDGSRGWYLNGKRHREDGPAIEFWSGSKSWWLNGIEYSEEEYWNQLKPAKELTIAEIEALLGHRIKVVGNV